MKVYEGCYSLRYYIIIVFTFNNNYKKLYTTNHKQTHTHTLENTGNPQVEQNIWLTKITTLKMYPNSVFGFKLRPRRRSTVN